ncbi:MAG TPA: hypothetical protein VGB55_13600, partial [Tepidisphaeraceae bacterium]
LSMVERNSTVLFPWWLTVSKLPLSPLEVVRYAALAVALAVTVDRLWPWISRSPVERVLAAIGVQSLMLWIAHTPIVGNVVTYPWLLALVMAAAGVWLAAVVANAFTRLWTAHLKHWPRPGFAVPVLGSVVLCGLLVYLESPLQMTQIETGDDSSVSDESSFFDTENDATPTPFPLDDDSISASA